MISKAQDLAAMGCSAPAIAAELGVNRSTVWHWLKKGRDGTGSDLHARFSDAIEKGTALVEKRCLSALARALQSDECRDSTPAAQWMLTHHPKCRDNWSDAAATRREVERVLGQVAQGISSSGLSSEQQQAVLLSMRAAGVGVNAADA